MAVRYLDNQHKESSGYIVSGREAILLKKHILDKSKADKLKTFKKTSSSISNLIKSFSA